MSKNKQRLLVVKTTMLGAVLERRIELSPMEAVSVYMICEQLEMGLTLKQYSNLFKWSKKETKGFIEHMESCISPGGEKVWNLQMGNMDTIGFVVPSDTDMDEFSAKYASEIGGEVEEFVGDVVQMHEGSEVTQ